ncbi:hypothetical protein HWV62_30567 [Athelia sp. TMB]|nr:hypothetical protein HWV62_30567 [Athelia sp. TMB]
MSSALDLSLGALEVGVLISVFLYGVTTVQTYCYYSGTAKDRCKVTVSYYGVPAAIGAGDWTLNLSGFFDGLSGALVQSFFAHRIYVLSRRWYITFLSWALSLIACTATLAITILSFKLSIAEFAIKYIWLVKASLALLLVVDVLNTTALCYYLRSERTGYSNTDSIMNKLFLWTLETGMITSCGGLIMLVFIFTTSSTTLWICVSIFYAKLYSNSLLATLNSRESLRNGLQDTQMSSAGHAARAMQVSVQHESAVSVEMSPRSNKLYEKGGRSSFTGNSFTSV